MVQILITFMAAAIILPVAYFQFRGTPLPKRMLIAGVIVVAALVSAFLQFLDLAFYMPLLAIVAISLIGAIGYGKIDEMEKQEKQRIAEKRRSKIPVDSHITEPKIITEPSIIAEEPMDKKEQPPTIETIPAKSYSMESITPERKEP